MPLEDCRRIANLHLCNDTADLADELLTGQLRHCRKSAFRRRVALQELMMQVRSKQARYAEAMALAREAFDTPGIGWTMQRLGSYEMLSGDLRSGERLADLRELAVRIFSLDRKLLRAMGLLFPLLCARAWVRFPREIRDFVAELFEAEVHRIGLPPDEIWAEPGLRAQIFKARNLKRAAGVRYAKMHLAQYEMGPTESIALIQEYIAQESVGQYRQLAKELLSHRSAKQAQFESS